MVCIPDISCIELLASLKRRLWACNCVDFTGSVSVNQCVHKKRVHISVCACVFGRGPNEPSPHPEGSSASSPGFRNNQLLYCSRKLPCCLHPPHLKYTHSHTKILVLSFYRSHNLTSRVSVTPWLWGNRKRKDRARQIEGGVGLMGGGVGFVDTWCADRTAAVTPKLWRLTFYNKQKHPSTHRDISTHGDRPTE